MNVFTMQTGQSARYGEPCSRQLRWRFRSAFSSIVLAGLMCCCDSVLPLAAAEPADSAATAKEESSGSDTKAHCCDVKDGQHQKAQHVDVHAGLKNESASGGVRLPDLELVDQDGKKVRFYTDLVKGKVVAINFFFTTCTTICPPLTANFANLQKQMADHPRADEFQMISISVDPVTDTPPRLKAWSKLFNAQPGWSFLTGDKKTVDTLLKALKVFTPLKEDHSPIILIGDERKGQWTRVYGLGSPENLVRVIQKTVDQAAQTPPDKEAATDSGTQSATSSDTGASPRDAAETDGNIAAHNYFSDVQLVNQHGEKMRLYSDLIKNKTVVINCFFTECVGVCPIANKNMQAIQEALGDRVGRDVHLISISVDPNKDTPRRLVPYSQQYGAKPGWYFLTGNKETVDFALSKLGYQVTTREQHSNVILVGNDRTGLWKKMFGLAGSQQLIPIVQQVVDDGPKENG